MKKILLSFLLVLMYLSSNGAIRIYEIYGGGGNSGAIIKADYVMIYNSGITAVNLSTFSLQYAPATSSSWQKFNLSGSIASDKFILIRLSPDGATGAALPTPDLDATANINNINQTDGKLVIMSNQTLITVNDPQTVSGVVDFVGYGGADASEGGTPSIGGTSTNTKGISRNATGNDTNNNFADFARVTPNPRNSTAAPLPVTLLSFKAALNERNQADLKWTTVSELDNDHFEIERSKNAIDFETLAIIKGIGTTDKRNDYTFTDETPLKGINYYRLKQIDIDGKFEYLRTVSVITEGNGELSLYPNPSAEVVKFDFADADQISEVAIYNTQGLLIKTISNSQAGVDVSELNVGKYIFKIKTTDDRNFSKSFVKK